MKKLLIAASLIALGLSTTACTGSTTSKLEVSSPIEMNYGIDLRNDTSDFKDFYLTQDFEYIAVEQYGPIAYKAISKCYDKFSNELNGVDQSSDEGDTILSLHNIHIAVCVDESLSLFPEVPEKYRVKIPRENAGLELNPEEVKSYNEPPAPKTPEPIPEINELPVNYYSTNDPRYAEVKKACEENNSSLSGSDFTSAVEFCVTKAM